MAKVYCDILVGQRTGSSIPCGTAVLQYALPVNDCCLACVRERCLLSQEVGGAIFVDIGSSLDVMNKITFQGNSLHIEYDMGLWVRAWKSGGTGLRI